MTAGCWAGLSPVDFRRLPLHAPIHPSFLGAAWRMGVEPCVGSSESCPLATRDAPGVCFDFLFGILACPQSLPASESFPMSQLFA